MKKLIYILLLLFSKSSFSQSVYYVQDVADNSNARDSNAGTDINYPWATWQKAFDTADAGDIVYFRGSIWYPTSKITLNPEIGIGNTGTLTEPIIFSNYPGEQPIVDFSNYTATGTYVGVDVANAINIEFYGLKMQNLWQNSDGQWLAGWNISNCGNVHIERMIATHIGGTGFWMGGNDSIRAINCDVYDIVDSTSTGIVGGRADGFNITSGSGPDEGNHKNYVITGCRAFRCSDDGFDISSSKKLLIYNNWSFDNGKLEGDATGYKLAYSTLAIPADPEDRMIRNNLSAWNISDSGEHGGGFVEVNLNADTYGPVTAYYNNTSYQDRQPFLVGLWGHCDTGYGNVQYVNNIAYDPYSVPGWSPSGNQFSACDYGAPIYSTHITNTWIPSETDHSAPLNPAFTVTDADFLESDSATIYNHLIAPRQADGSLPVFTGLTLTSGSDLIDGGTDVGLPYSGVAPDLGAEFVGN
jgi:hypothetical protein